MLILFLVSIGTVLKSFSAFKPLRVGNLALGTWYDLLGIIGGGCVGLWVSRWLHKLLYGVVVCAS